MSLEYNVSLYIYSWTWRGHEQVYYDFVASLD